MIETIRAFFSDQGFLEVETPIRIPAPAPELHIDAQESGSWFLQTSPELCMKRLLCSGYEKIFQICRCFRKGERGRFHLPEMTLLEWYVAGFDYQDMMVQCEQLIRFIADRLGIGRYLTYQGHRIDLTPPFERLTVSEAFVRHGEMTAEKALQEDLFDEIMGVHIEPTLGLRKPIFLYDYPARCGALARCKPENSNVAERFELYIAGIELCNAFSELTDPEEQRYRFEMENQRRMATGKKKYPTAEPFLRELSEMPAAAGNALGIDRLAMLFTDSASIDRVVSFTPEML